MASKPTGRPRGRPPGSLTRRTREIAEKAAALGLSPLEVLLDVMRQHFAAGELDKAVEAARSAAPYCHPRLQSIELSGKDGGPINWAGVASVDIEQELIQEYLGLGFAETDARALAHAASAPDGSAAQGFRRARALPCPSDKTIS
jgi:hypothetical protein